MMDRNTDTRRVGPSSGSVMLRTVCRRLAPSMAAASSSSRGMPCRPASIRIMWKPKYFHEMTTNIVSITIDRSASHSWTRNPSPPVWSAAVHHAVRVEQQLEHDARRRLGQHVRREEQQSQQRPTPEGPVELERQPQRERDLDRQRQDDDEQVVPDRSSEHRVVERLDVVVEADEVGRGVRGHSSRTGCTTGLDDGKQHEQPVDDQRGQQEEPDRQPSAGPRSGTFGCDRVGRHEAMVGERVGVAADPLVAFEETRLTSPWLPR